MGNRNRCTQQVKHVGNTFVFCFGAPSGDREEIFSSEGSEDAETSPPCGASLWLGVEDFLGLTALL